jgi:hypothetical protein
MPAQTPVHGLPYPLPTDPVSAGANDIRALAEAIDPMLVGAAGDPGAILLGAATQIGGAAFGGWNALQSGPPQQIMPSFAVLAALFGPGRRFTQCRWIASISCDSINGCTSWNIACSTWRLFADLGPTGFPQSPPMALALIPNGQVVDSGWLTLPSFADPGWNGNFQLCYQINTATANPTNSRPGIGLWVR